MRFEEHCLDLLLIIVQIGQVDESNTQYSTHHKNQQCERDKFLYCRNCTGTYYFTVENAPFLLALQVVDVVLSATSSKYTVYSTVLGNLRTVGRVTKELKSNDDENDDSTA